jgi:hypothetical protein
MTARLAGVLVACLLVSAVLAGQAAAACGGVIYRAPKRMNAAHRPPLAIGDSTMLLAVKPLARAGIEANARGCRPVSEGLRMLSVRRRAHRLPKVVLLHLGLNGGISTKHIRRALRILGPRRILVLGTGRGGKDLRVIKRAGKRWPRRVRVLDWVRAYRGHREYFSEPSGLHLSQTGVRVFVRMCRKRLLPLNRRR